MKLAELYAEVSRRTDTSGTAINVAETSRVCAKLFEVLSEQAPGEMLELLAKGVKAHTEK